MIQTVTLGVKERVDMREKCYKCIAYGPYACSLVSLWAIKDGGVAPAAKKPLCAILSVSASSQSLNKHTTLHTYVQEQN